MWFLMVVDGVSSAAAAVSSTAAAARADVSLMSTMVVVMGCLWRREQGDAKCLSSIPADVDCAVLVICALSQSLHEAVVASA